MVSALGFSDMLSIAQTVGIVGTMVLTLYFSKKQVRSLSIDTQTRGLNDLALSAAFINGIKAFGMDEKGSPLLMPILKLSYNEIISESKIKILKAIDETAY